MNLLIFLESERAGLQLNCFHSATKTSLSCGIHSLQKIGGLFNGANEKFAGTDWIDPVTTVQTISSTFSPSPKDIAEFLFPSVSDGGMLSSYPQNVYKESSNDLAVILAQTEDTLAGHLDFCEVFTDLDDLMSMDANQFMQQLTPSVEACKERSCELLSVPAALTPTVSQLDAAAAAALSNPDHSYSTVKHDPLKRKLHEITSCGEEDETDLSHHRGKHSRYLERRKKNNIASKRSRETRKNKFVEMDVETHNLEKANEELRKRIEQLESLTKQMKEALVARLASTAGH